MRTDLMAASVALLVGAVALAGCNDDDPDAWLDDYAFVWEGEHVSVYGYDLEPSDACAGSFAALETHTRSVMDLLGVDDSLHYDYRWMSQAAWQGVCPLDAGACNIDGEPRTRTLPDMHEVVHSVAYALPEHGCASMLEEGLGKYLDGPSYYDAPLTERDIREELGERVISQHFYARAGQFVSFLLERYGAQRFVELCEALPRGSSLAAWEAASREVLDTSLDALLADYRHYPECSPQQYRARLWECAGEPDFVFSVDNDVIELEADCSDPRAMNSNPGQIVITRRVFVPEPIMGAVSVVVAGKGSLRGSFMIQECAPCSAEPQVIRDDGGPPIYGLDPGMHELVLFLDSRDGDSLSFRMHRPP